MHPARVLMLRSLFAVVLALLTISTTAFAHPQSGPLDRGTPAASDAPEERGDSPITVKVTLAKAPALNEPVTATIRVQSSQDAPGTQVDLVLPAGVQALGGGTSWRVDLARGAPTTVSREIVATQPGNHMVAANARYQAGPDEAWGDSDAAYIHAEAGRGQFGYRHAGNPAAGAAVPVPGAAQAAAAAPSLSLGDGTTNESAPTSEADAPPVAAPTAPGEGVAALAATCATPGAGQLRINGSWHYQDRNGVQQPLKLLVQLLKSDNTHIAFTYSEWDGTFCFTVANPGAFKVRMYTFYQDVGMTYQAIRIVPNGAGGGFFDHEQTYFVTGSFAAQPNGTFNAGGMMPHPDYTGRYAWWIYDDVQRRGYMWPYNDVPPGQPQGSRLPDGTTIEWQDDSTEGTYHLLGRVYLEGIDKWSPHVILHEYGHNVHRNVYDGNTAVTNCPKPHEIDKVSTLNCAWTEGFASFWAIGVLNDPDFKWPCAAPCTPAHRNLETANANSSDWDDGDTVESRVTGALWDLLDANNEGYDKTTLPLWQIWDVFYTQNDDNFPQFWAAWKTKGYDVRNALPSFYQNTIDYNSAPTIAGLPNRTVNAGQTLSNTIYLPDFANDPDHAETLLNYSVTLAPDCLNVTIDSNHRVDLAPTANCGGTHDVTIFVQDGITGDTDTFTVTVKYVLALSSSAGGSASANPAGAAHTAGTTVTLTATPNQGYVFTGWTIDGAAAGNTNPRTLTMNGNKTVVANFAVPSILTLSSSAGGSASANPPGPSYFPGTVVTLTATANPGYVFTGWTINNAAAGNTTPLGLAMNGNRTVVANFAAIAPPPPPPPPPSGTTYTLSLSTGNGGSASGGGSYTAGQVATLTATPDAGSVFTGWTVDGQLAGWANPLTLTMTADHAVAASFAPRPAFPDVPAGDPAEEAIGQLAARGIIKGYADGRFGPQDSTLRAQMAALIARAMGWDSEDHGNSFPDQGSVDANLWRNVGTLAFYGVAKGYQDGSYKPTNPVLNAQVISFITRAMVAKGYWQAQPDDPALYPDVPAASGHRADLATYAFYAGAVPGTDPAGWGGWAEPSTRGWFALAQWQALNSYWSVDRVP